MTREEIQREGLELTKLHYYIMFEWCTGLGKSLVAIQIIELYGGKWNIVLAETNHELNWIEEFKKHNKKYLLDNVTFFCYQSLHKNIEGENYIFDELHHITSEKRLELLQKIHLSNLKRFIGLSATLTRTQKELIEDSIGKFYIHKITLSQAIGWKILPEPTVYFIGVELSNTSKYLKYYFTRDKFIMCTEKEYYDRITSRIETLKKTYFSTQQEFDRIRWLKLANDRKKFLANCKTRHIRELLKYVDNKRFICFTGSIEQSDALSNGLSVHSKIPKKKRIELITDFNNGKIDKLFATGMLKEGINLENIEVGLIIQLDNTLRYFSQTHGRTLRSSFPEQYVMYVKDTQDETYIKTALEDFNMDYVKFIELKNLKK